jgi:hypothetical protein
MSMALVGLAKSGIAVALAVGLAGCGLSDTDISKGRRGSRLPPSVAAGSASPAGKGGGSVDPAGAGGDSGGSGDDGRGGSIAVGSGSGGGGVDPGGTGGPGVTPPPFDAGSEPDRNEVVAGELCDRFATIQCAGEGSCCPSAGRDFNACKSALMGVCTADLLFDQISMQPSAGFDEARAHDVLDDLEDFASRCDPGIVAYNESQQGLRSMFRGTIGPDQSCRPSNLLSKPQAGAALASCTMSETWACLPSTIAWTCTRRGGAGSACFTDINCTPGFFCDNPDLNIAGSNCMPRKADDAACRAGNECTSLFCIGGKCVPPSASGAYCPE